MVPSSNQAGAFEARYQVMLNVAFSTLRSDPELKLCEGLRLIEATRTAVARHAPSALGTFDSRILPQLRQALMDRFGMVICPECDIQ
ncbi:MAG: hypothetical protein K8R59_11345 [Thermoanaerobaculales bacterium]|nr:hypothetical protein [Thermoanaerobaculales bacterium]